ncbi:MAG TPA: hypothetical protein VM051_09280 [Usitatibacter sp.]|nr:hypothetical protein [Usitatibacter sp.]
MKTIQRTFLALLLAAGAASGAEGIAFITNIKGEISVDGNTRPALLSELGRGQRIVVGKESQASVMYIASGKEYILRGPADYTIKDTEVTGSIGMPPVTRDTGWRTSNKVLAQVSQTSAASVRMRSLGKPRVEEPKLLYPTQGAVATLQPTFRWRAENKAQGEFMLMAVGHEKPVHLAKAAGGSYRIPAKLLAPDTEYAWTVTVAGNELGAGKFRTLGSDALAQVEMRRPSERADFSDRLLFTLMLHEMGAVQEARESWARLAQERADLPELASLAK